MAARPATLIPALRGFIDDGDIMDESTVLPPAALACGVSFDGRAYHYQGYTYALLPDALDYARLDRARSGPHEDPMPRYWRQWAAPTEDEWRQMRAYGITYDHGCYRYGPYRYELLSAALAYARNEPALSCPESREEG